MSPIAGQTAEPFGRKFFVDTHGWPGGFFGLKKIRNFFFIFFHGQRQALQLALNKV